MNTIPESRERFVAILRSAVSHEDAARMLREFMAREVFGRIAVQMEVPDPAVRAGLAAAQMVGLAMMRYVIGFEPLVRASADEIVALTRCTIVSGRLIANVSANWAMNAAITSAASTDAAIRVSTSHCGRDTPARATGLSAGEF